MDVKFDNEIYIEIRKEVLRQLIPPDDIYDFAADATLFLGVVDHFGDFAYEVDHFNELKKNYMN